MKAEAPGQSFAVPRPRPAALKSLSATGRTSTGRAAGPRNWNGKRSAAAAPLKVLRMPHRVEDKARKALKA